MRISIPKLLEGKRERERESVGVKRKEKKREGREIPLHLSNKTSKQWFGSLFWINLCVCVFGR